MWVSMRENKTRETVVIENTHTNNIWMNISNIVFVVVRRCIFHNFGEALMPYLCFMCVHSFMVCEKPMPQSHRFLWTRTRRRTTICKNNSFGKMEIQVTYSIPFLFAFSVKCVVKEHINAKKCMYTLCKDLHFHQQKQSTLDSFM